MDPYSPPTGELKAGAIKTRGWGPLSIFYVLAMLVSIAVGPRLLLQGPPLSLIPLSAPLAVLLIPLAAVRDGLRREKLARGVLIALASLLSAGLVGLLFHVREPDFES